jgi:serine/threonine protein kinase
MHVHKAFHLKKRTRLSGSSPAPYADPITGSLASQLDVATPILQANHWVTKPQLDHLRSRVLEATAPTTIAGRSALAQFLLDNRLLPRDQILDLDAILKSQVTLPEFQLQRKIGSGGMGTVFLALHHATGRSVALKTMNARLAEDKDFIERFHREARSLEAVRNEHIAEIIASGENDGTCWLAMEYIEGPSLMKLLKEHRLLPEAYALSLAIQLAEGLGHVWDKAGLVHRDLKPENILVVRAHKGDVPFPLTDVAKLIDFGLVKSNNDDDRLTQTGMTIGTPLYMSPEQVRGEKLDCRSDIYGLGATLYHLLTGSTPFSGTSPGAIMSAHLTESVPDPGDRVPSLSKATRTLVMTAMAKEVDKRPASFAAFGQACRDALEKLEEKSEASPKFLRKPLVIKQPVRRGDAPAEAANHPANASTKMAPTVVTPTSTGHGSRPPSEIVSRPPTSSFNRPAAPGRPASGQVTRPPSGLVTRPLDPAAPHALPNPGQAPIPGPVRQVPSTGPLPPITASSGRSNAVSSSTDQANPPSAAFLEPHPSPGIGMLPWVVLGFALLALSVFLVMSYL